MALADDAPISWGIEIEMCYEPISLINHGGTAIQEVTCAIL